MPRRKDPTRCSSCQSRTRPLVTKSLCQLCREKLKTRYHQQKEHIRNSVYCKCGELKAEGRQHCHTCLAYFSRASIRYRAQHLEEQRAKDKRYYWRNHEYKLAQRQQYTAKIRHEVLNAYGNSCACCGETTPEFLQVDHIDGTGALHRVLVGTPNIYQWLKQHGFPKDNFQLLCANCNWAKGRWGACPHQKGE